MKGKPFRCVNDIEGGKPDSRRCPINGYPARFAFIGTAILVLGACAPGVDDVSSGSRATDTYVLLEPAAVLHDDWRHMPLRSATEYRIVHMDDRLAVRAVGRDSASGVIRRIDVDPHRCPVLEWEWRVDRMQADADLRTKAGDDVAAALFLLFGDPGFLADPEPVPTLRYVWSGGTVPLGSVIDNPYMPGVVRNIVIESGPARRGQWIGERRNIIEDFERAFGKAAPDTVEAFALFTDNDQTRQPVTANYGAARLLCD